MEQKDKRIKYNMITAVVYQLVLVGINFILPRLYLENFGSEVNGVMWTLRQIFMYMCLLQAGVGLASTQALYKCFGNNDYDSVSSVLSATHKYYIKTGIVYSACVLVLAFVYGFVVPTCINSFELFVIVLLHGLPTIFGFFVQAKYDILLEADGRKYVKNNSDTVVQFAANIAKLLVLIFTNSLVLVQLVYCVISIGQMAYLYWYAKRQYKWLNLKAEPDNEAIAQRNSVLVHQVSGMVFQNTDVMLISWICGYVTGSVYNIYNTFFLQMQNFITAVSSGFTFALGQMFNTDRARFDKVYYAYETFYIMISFIIYTLMAVFLLPVIQLYTKGINDANYTNEYLLLLFVIMNLLANGKLPVNGLLEYSGSFEKTRSHAVWEMIINIVVSVVAISCIGICGAIVGTIVALIYRSIVMIHYVNRKVLGRSIMGTYGSWIVNGAVFAVVMAVFFVDSFSNVSFGRLVIHALVHSVWIAGAYVLINFIFRREAFRTLIELVWRKKEI